MPKETIKYEIDPHNNLILKESAQETDIPRFRKVISGKFKLDKNNNLSYLVRAPAQEAKNVPHQLKLKGKWSLDKQHNLCLSLDKWGRQTFGDKITLAGEIADISKNSLLFELTTYKKDNTPSKYVLKFAGSWAADKNNQLTFRARKERGRHDILTLKGSWDINKHNRLTYTYEKAALIRKRKLNRNLVFKGYWDIRGKKRLYYVLDKKDNSEFGFRVDFAQFKANYIKYKVGIRAEGEARVIAKTITLSGEWKIKRGLGLVFEVEYENRQAKAISFGAEAELKRGNIVSFKLRDNRNRPLGYELKLSRNLLKGRGEAFIKFLKEAAGGKVLIGTGFKW